jgi:hypothetical protein
MNVSVLVTGSSSSFERLIVETLLKEDHTVFAKMIGLQTFRAKS